MNTVYYSLFCLFEIQASIKQSVCPFGPKKKYKLGFIVYCLKALKSEKAVHS